MEKKHGGKWYHTHGKVNRTLRICDDCLLKAKLYNNLIPFGVGCVLLFLGLMGTQTFPEWLYVTFDIVGAILAFGGNPFRSNLDEGHLLRIAKKYSDETQNGLW